MAALNALYESFMIQNNFMDFEKLSIQQTTLEDFVLIDTKTISDLELLASKKPRETQDQNSSNLGKFKKSDKCFLAGRFECATFGGERMLRASII